MDLLLCCVVKSAMGSLSFLRPPLLAVTLTMGTWPFILLSSCTACWSFHWENQHSMEVVLVCRFLYVYNHLCLRLFSFRDVVLSMHTFPTLEAIPSPAELFAIAPKVAAPFKGSAPHSTDT